MRRAGTGSSGVTPSYLPQILSKPKSKGLTRVREKLEFEGKASSKVLCSALKFELEAQLRKGLSVGMSGGAIQVFRESIERYERRGKRSREQRAGIVSHHSAWYLNEW